MAFFIALFTAFAGFTGNWAQPAPEERAKGEWEQPVPRKDARVVEIRQLYKRITRAVESNSIKILRYFNRGPGWEVQDASLIKKESETNNTKNLSAATVYLQKNKIVRIVDRHSEKNGITLRSYYFYDNETTAYVFERRYIFSGEESNSSSSFMMESKIYFSPAGKEIDRKITWSRKPKNAIAPRAPVIYLNTKSFKFYRLVQEQLASEQNP